jgi:(R,R)-butanediol dehydrogenase/meso-butanediol dehydrogenase/diacetyl reductase
MELVQIHGPGVTRLDDVHEPEPGPRDVVVDVAACGVCGSDLKYIALGGVGGPSREPVPLGHEFSGTVSFVGDEVPAREAEVGRRVVVHPGNNPVSHIGNGGTEGAFTRRVLIREAALGGRLFTVPDEISFDIAALTEPVGVGMNAADKAQVTEGDRVAIFGVGPIGLAALATCLDRGATDIVAIDMSPERLAIAAQMGAGAALHAADDDVWGTLRERHGTSGTVFGPMAGTDAYIECSGVASVITDVINRAGYGARLSVAGLHFSDIPVSFLTVLTKELTIRGAMEYPDRFEDALDLIRRRDVSPMITDRIPLEQWDQVQTRIDGPASFAKIMVTMT